MGSSSPCTCNVRVCNYHKQGGYGFENEKANINTKTQVEDLKNTLTKFMDDLSSPTTYFRTGVQSTPGVTASQAALNKLRNTIASVTPIEGLTMDSFCVNVADSYEKPSAQQFQPSEMLKEGYALINPPNSSCSTLICIIIGIILFSLAIYFIYRYINCPCRKRNEKALQEALNSP